MPFPSEVIYRQAAIALALQQLSSVGVVWPTLTSSPRMRALVEAALVQERACDKSFDDMREELVGALTVRPETQRDLERTLAAAAHVGLNGLPLEWTEASRGPYRRVVASVLDAEGYHDGAGWPLAPSCRRYYATAPEPAKGLVLAAIPTCAEAPLLVGNFLSLADLELGVDVVVSLCRTGARDVPEGIAHYEFWLDDTEKFGESRMGHEVVSMAIKTVIVSLTAHRSVLLHCAVGRSRSPRVAAMSISRLDGIPLDEALRRVKRYVPASERLTLGQFAVRDRAPVAAVPRDEGQSR